MCDALYYTQKGLLEDGLLLGPPEDKNKWRQLAF